MSASDFDAIDYSHALAVYRDPYPYADIRISEREHGPADARRYDYSTIYMLRGLERLHLEFRDTA